MTRALRKSPKYARSLILGVMLASPMVIRGAQSDLHAAEQAEVEKHLWCPCGCSQGLGECNHIGCPSAPPMRSEVSEYLDEGLDVDAVLDRFEDKYGPTILTAPSTEGWFDLSAWLMPFAGLLAGVGGYGVYARRFRNRGVASRARSAGQGSADDYDERIEAELADFTPED